MELLSPRSFEEVVVGEGLQARRFAHSEAARLARVRMDVVMSVFGDVRNDRRGRGVPDLHSKSVGEGCSNFPDIAMFRMK